MGIILSERCPPAIFRLGRGASDESARSAWVAAPSAQNGRAEALPFVNGRELRIDGYEQPLVVPQLTHLWQLPLGIMIDPHSGQVGASVRAMKL